MFHEEVGLSRHSLEHFRRHRAVPHHPALAPQLGLFEFCGGLEVGRKYIAEALKTQRVPAAASLPSLLRVKQLPNHFKARSPLHFVLFN